MTQLKMENTLRCAVPPLPRAVRLWSAVLALVTACAVTTANAEVRLENTIKKVETFVNEAGEVERRLVDAHSVVPGDELQYTVRFSNNGKLPVDAGTIVITDAIPAHTEYLDGTAFGAGTDIWFSVDGEAFAPPQDLMVVKDGTELPAAAKDYRSIRWTFGPALKPGDSGYVSFNVRLK